MWKVTNQALDSHRCWCQETRVMMTMMMVGMMTIMIKGKITIIMMTRMMKAGYYDHFHDDHDDGSSLM